jgi:carbamoyltransferase
VPKGLTSFTASIPIWIREKVFMKKLLRSQLEQFGKKKVQLLFPEHHLSHAASAFYPSPFEEAAILTVDGVGEWATTSICHGKGNCISVLRQLDYPHSIGLLYAAFTSYLGFKVNSGEYKLMGLAPYGNPEAEEALLFRKKILERLVDIREDGSILLNMDYFDFATSLRMTNNKKWELLFGFPARKPESEILSSHMNLAWAIQHLTESCMIKLADTAKLITGSKNLVLAGGVALNCVANTKILNAGLFEQIWIQPASGDAGGSLGAAMAAFHIAEKKPRVVSATDAMKNAFLGPAYGNREIENVIRRYEAVHENIPDFDKLSELTARRISEGNVIGWFQDRMEFGPRALGNRSILGDPRNPDMQRILNLKIKFREAFRPFAPAVLREDYAEYFEEGQDEPYMLFISRLRKEYLFKAAFPSVTHVDYTSRVQTVDRDMNPKFWQLISAFKKITGCGMLINTSFNVRGEPIVCTPQEAFLGFMRTDMDCLVLGNFFFDKKKQKSLPIPEMNISGLID